MKVIGHFINGREVSSSSKKTANVFNPATGEIQRKVSLGLASELNEAVKKAKESQPAWGATNPQKRARVIMKLSLIHISEPTRPY